jgi:hypothetical protein
MKRSVVIAVFIFLFVFDTIAQQSPYNHPQKVISQWPQQVPDFPITRDSNFLFNKQYYELEDQWAVFPQKTYNIYTKGMYTLALIYFDAAAGYSMINLGLFDVNAKGHAYRDTTAPKLTFVHNDFKESFVIQLTQQSVDLAAPIPDNMLKDMKLEKAPYWLPAYHAANPDTIKTLARKLLFGHLFRVYARDVAQHIGETVMAEGRLYGGIVKPDPVSPNVKIEFLYMGGGNYPNQKLTVIINNASSNDEKWLASLDKIDLNTQGQKISLNDIHSAKGKIFLYEGKPAIEIKSGELGSLASLDNGPSQLELQKYQ